MAPRMTKPAPVAQGGREPDDGGGHAHSTEDPVAEELARSQRVEPGRHQLVAKLGLAQAAEPVRHDAADGVRNAVQDAPDRSGGRLVPLPARVPV